MNTYSQHSSQPPPTALRQATGLLIVALALLAAAAVPTGAQSTAPRSRSGRAAAQKAAKAAAKQASASTKAAPAPAVKPVEKPVTVVVRPNCDVTGPVFKLGDIADIQGDDKALAAQLAAIEIGASPLPGLSRIINPGDVTVRLRQYHLDTPRVAVTLPPGMRISRSGLDIASDDISRAALESARDAIKSQPDATLEVVSGASRLVVPAGKAQILAGAWRGSPDIGLLTVPVSVLVDGRPVQTVEVSLRMHRKIKAVVALRDIQVHEVLGPQDVALLSIDLVSGPRSPLTNVDEGVGKRATRRILANTPVVADMLEKAPLVSANDAVTIEFIYGGLRVTAAGIARQTGSDGDTIHVFASDTHKELDAIVIDKHTVRVEDNSNR